MKKTTIKQKVKVSAKPEEVYEAFADAKIHSLFTQSKATGKAKVGEKFTAWDGYISGKFLELEKGKRIVQEWVTTEWPRDFPPSRFELNFKAAKGATEISMIHSDVPAEMAEDLGEGWNEFYWKPLRDYFKKNRAKQK